MKKISWIAGLLMLVVFSGCFDTVDEFTIAENGSGTFVNSLNMGKILGLAKTMGSGNDEMKDLDKLKTDTVVNIKDIKDSLKKLTDAEKKIVATGTLRMQIDANEEKLNFTFTFPFSNTSQIAPIQSVLKKAKGDILDDIMTKLMGEGGNKDLLGKEEDNEQAEEMGVNLEQYYTTVYEKGKFSRKLNKEKYANVGDDKSLKSLQEMAQMGMPINMKTIINLPKPAKKAEGKGIKLSEDKKKITMEGSLDDFLEDGSYFEYNIEY
ncbi:MAG TPA: hypothetical protein VGQ04_11525 [Chitinophagaceae bacterium]|nr:hypothetical protein [Chitinophagaceae bacterium]